MAARRWTLETARAILPDVRQRTELAAKEVESLVRQRAAINDPEQALKLDQNVARVVSLWIRSMEALGVSVKGAWLVDFDTGGGCYCWRWPEERLEYFHGPDEGFAGRIRIQ